MYTDLCFPAGNEKAFIEYAKRLSIKSVCFAYGPIKKQEGNIYRLKCGQDSKKELFLCDRIPVNARKKEDFAYMLDNDFLNMKLTQVIAKEIAERELLIGIPLCRLVNEKNVEKTVGRMSLVLKLFQKYKVRMFAASFATSVFDLRQRRDACAFLGRLGLDQKEVLCCSKRLDDFLEGK